MAHVLAKTDGVPLFVEEFTRTVLDSSFLVDGGDHWELDGPIPALAIPSTLQDSLVSRLDRLSSAKEVAQLGACIGREFSYELIAAVSSARGGWLTEALDAVYSDRPEDRVRKASPITRNHNVCDSSVLVERITFWSKSASCDG